MAAERWILTLACDDRVGIVAAVSGFLAERDGFIVDSQQYADLDTGRFFMRVVVQAGGPRFERDTRRLRAAFTYIAGHFDLGWALVDDAVKPRAVVAVSKGGHCLNDLLFRRQAGSLAVEIAAVVSNHETLRGLAEWHGVPFHYLPVNAAERPAQEAAIERLIEDEGAELLVLARYMQVLTPDFAGRLGGRCVNIHHSFLPGFKGARPYHRAHERGVKLIGATAHFVTGDLDEGPIIEQAVERVDHRATVDDLIAIGRDIEAQVLARAVNAIGERRVFLNGGKTVVFR
jgi:formyltetrahydrofolate deformylase